MTCSSERLNAGDVQQTREIMHDAAVNAVPTLPDSNRDADGTMGRVSRQWTD
jgi:hypothetical protein